MIQYSTFRQYHLLYYSNLCKEVMRFPANAMQKHLPYMPSTLCCAFEHQRKQSLFRARSLKDKCQGHATAKSTITSFSQIGSCWIYRMYTHRIPWLLYPGELHLTVIKRPRRKWGKRKQNIYFLILQSLTFLWCVS